MEPVAPLRGLGLICISLVVFIFLGGGLYLILSNLRSRRLASESARWPSTSGRVIRSDVLHDSDSDGNWRYHALVEYEYQVAGQSFTSRNIAFGPTRSYPSEAPARAEADRYPPGQMVNVFYNPQNPREVALVREASHSSATLIIGIALIAVSMCLAIPLIGGIFFAITQ